MEVRVFGLQRPRSVQPLIRAWLQIDQLRQFGQKIRAKQQAAKNALGHSRTLVQLQVNVPFAKINVAPLD